MGKGVIKLQIDTEEALVIWKALLMYTVNGQPSSVAARLINRIERDSRIKVSDEKK